MRSMTGYGRGSAPLGGGRVEVEIRSLNHRFLEVRTRMPRALADLSADLEQWTRARLRRGRVEVQATLEGSTGIRVTVDHDLARDAFQALLRVRDELAPGEPLPLGLLASLPDLFAPPRSGKVSGAGEALRAAFSAAADRLDEMRSAEGSALARDLSDRLAAAGALVQTVRARVPDVIGAARERLRERTARLLAGGGATYDPSRIEQEIVLLAERGDVSEELARLESHREQLARLLEAPGELGRRIEFLVQEMGREANTIGAKSQDAGLAWLVIDLKVEIERLREQSQNVE